MGALILPLLALMIFVLVVCYGWLIFRPEPQAKPMSTGGERRRGATPTARQRR